MITVTELASKKIKQQLERRGHGLGIRLGVKTTGCSGLAYLIEYVDNVDSADTVCYTNGVNIYIDPKSLAYLNGLVLDWKRQGLNEGFDFQNPNARDYCGCGESFRI